MESHYPINVKPLPNHQLFLTFDNGESRLFDLRPYLTISFFAPLQKPDVFQSVRISPISVEWDGGIDICPDELYYNSIPAGESP